MKDYTTSYWSQEAEKHKFLLCAVMRRWECLMFDRSILVEIQGPYWADCQFFHQPLIESRKKDSNAFQQERMAIYHLDTSQLSPSSPQMPSRLKSMLISPGEQREENYISFSADDVRTLGVASLYTQCIPRSQSFKSRLKPREEVPNRWTWNFLEH